MGSFGRQPHEIFGAFELVERIGVGGMATVHRAVRRGPGGFRREVVVKRILPELASDRQFIRMLIEEAKFGACLDHPNIVQIHDLGCIRGQYYISMEYIDGVSLLETNHRLGERCPVQPELAAFIVQQVCTGLHYAHNLSRDGTALGLVHRDVSPANVMVCSHGVVKLLDFGIAKAFSALDREQTRAGTLKGKLSYMSPEQVEGRTLDARSDIFVTGTLLWETLSGRRLFKDKTEYLTLRNVMRAPVPRLTAIRPSIPAALDDICARALARRPDERYAASEQMAHDLEHRVLCRSSVGPAQLEQLVSQVRALRKAQPLSPPPTHPSGPPPVPRHSPTPRSGLGSPAGDVPALARILSPPQRTRVATPTSSAGSQKGRRPTVSWPPRQWLLAAVVALVGSAAAVVALLGLLLHGNAVEAPCVADQQQSTKLRPSAVLTSAADPSEF